MTTQYKIIEALRELVSAMDSAYISSWQSTATWAKQLDVARAALAEYDAQPQQEQAHTDHPARHYDRTCPACNQPQQCSGAHPTTEGVKP